MQFKGLSVFELEIPWLRKRVLCPIYPYPELEPFYGSIIYSLTIRFIREKWSEECVVDHKGWKLLKVPIEALQFLDKLSKDFSFLLAIKAFNECYKRKHGIEALQYSKDWIEPLRKYVPRWEHAIAQLGDFVYSIVKWNIKVGYFNVYRFLGISLIRPYFVKPRRSTLIEVWLERAIVFIDYYRRLHGKLPSLKTISLEMGVSKSSLRAYGITLTTLYDTYRRYRETGKILLVRSKGKYRLLRKDDIRKIAESILARTFG